MSADDIDRLIERYGQAAFDLAMRQVWIDLAFTLVVAVVATIGAIMLVTFAWRQYREYRAYTGPSYETMSDMNALLSGAFGGMVTLVAFFTWAAVISTLLNPAWAALQKLLPGV